MEAIIQNLGPIKNNKQSIDLTKKFYVFVGGNNSGKTYVSQLLWTIFNETVIRRFSSSIDINLNFKNKNSFNIDEALIEDILKKYSVFLKEELARTYNIDNTSYQETILEKFSIHFNFDFEKVKKMKVEGIVAVKEDEKTELFFLTKETGKLQIIFEDKDTNFLLKKLNKKEIQKINREKPGLKKTAFISSIIQLLLNYTHSTFFLPASRTFYTTFYQYIYDFERERYEKDIKRLIDLFESHKGNVKKFNLEEIDLFKSPYSRPLNDLFEKLYNFNKDIESTNYYPNLTEKIIELMGGSIEMGKAENISMINFFFKMSKTEDALPMHMASSSVNQLTLLYFYLKYWAKKEFNFLMIDEPEENLNPKNQIKLLEILLDFANEKTNKVLVTTHSSLFTDAINNYLYLDILKNKFDINIDDFLQDNHLKYLNPNVSFPKEELGAYFFNGEQIIDYTGEDYGVFFRDFKEITSAVEENNRILTDFIYLKEQENHG